MDNHDFTATELIKIYNLLMNNSDSCENLELKNKIASMLNKRIEEGRDKNEELKKDSEASKNWNLNNINCIGGMFSPNNDNAWLR